MVRVEHKAWHCIGKNNESIGIECSAEKGDRLTDLQEKKLIHLLRWLMVEYGIGASKITAHRFTGQNTDCPGSLWRDEKELNDWVNKHLA
jgi:N-acetyl-anhydromuramyl-L-alanine amidase AmpD